jgi:kynureninase
LSHCADPLAEYRSKFFIPPQGDGREQAYLCGHSLGLQPRSVRKFIEAELEDWAQLGVEGHFRARSPWMPYHRLLTDQAARLVGAKPSEVVVMNSLTVNLHLMMVSFYRPTIGRHKIVVEAGAFPSDQYAVKSQIRFHGYNPTTSLIELRPREGEDILREEDVCELIGREGESIALILMGGVNYSTGQAFDMRMITAAGHEQGCVVAFDLAHAAGNLVLKLHEWDVDWAAWCSYKYLNAGPGAIAGCFVHERHGANVDLPRFAGWWGHDEATRFKMSPEFHPMQGADGWQLSNPSIFSMAPLRASLELFGEAGMPKLREKSEALTAYLEEELTKRADGRFSIVTPGEKSRRGAQLSIRVGSRRRDLVDQLAAQGVICDWREPAIVRAAPVPLYNSFEDVERFVEIFCKLI